MYSLPLLFIFSSCGISKLLPFSTDAPVEQSDNIEKPRPPVLYVCGHSCTQKVHYQHHACRFAQLGLVYLIIETIQW